ncbi:MAG: RsmB/NOP family class I SAM-dependent RNA methyltransferase [Acidobacteriota bacterium]
MSAPRSDAAQAPERFARYRPIVDDWDAFLGALARPLPVTLRAHPHRGGVATATDWLAREGFTVAPLPWDADALYLADGARPGASIARLGGLAVVQEAAAMLAVPLLDARPGMRVLDLCAAPGNKTVQLAWAVAGNDPHDERGLVVANDRSVARLGVLRGAIRRLGLANVAVVQHDACGLPAALGTFDRVLADVPCSCEGTSRRNPTILRRPHDGGRRVHEQRAMLRAAIERCRPGGRVVYATCTYAPEENELVVARVLDEIGSAVTLRDAHALLPAGLVAGRGLTAWAGTRLPETLAGCVRLMPHHSDTGGFFLAVLDKAVDAPAMRARETDAVDPARLPDDEATALLDAIGARYGFDASTLGRYTLRHARGRILELVPRSMDLAWTAHARVRAVAAGLPFAHAKMTEPRLTSGAARRYASNARRRALDLDWRETLRFFTPHEQHLARVPATIDADDRHPVLVRHDGIGLGPGAIRPRAGGGVRLQSLLPKSVFHDRAAFVAAAQV